jgi:hypothetical protein
MTGPILYVMLTWLTWATFARIMMGDFGERISDDSRAFEGV